MTMNCPRTFDDYSAICGCPNQDSTHRPPRAGATTGRIEKGEGAAVATPSVALPWLASVDRGSLCGLWTLALDTGLSALVTGAGHSALLAVRYPARAIR